jgi:tetratricopeptide (TPR) repeat protein
VFDDFEQNLTLGGAAFADPAFDDLFTDWCDAAEVGALLITCRYPLPGEDRYLVPIPVPPLSPAELRRLFLRLPALRDLPPEDERLLTRVIGGHPRLIEYVDALIRGRPVQLRSVQTKLRRLAADTGIDLRSARPLGEAIDASLILGSADILLTELLALLTDHERELIDQLAVSRAPMTLDDLADTLRSAGDGERDMRRLRSEIEHLIDLTLLTPGADVVINPWTAEILDRHTRDGRDERHERALATRLRRFERGVASYPDLLDIARHLAALRRYDDLRGIAEQAARMLPGALAYSAFLADIRPLVPDSEPASRAIGKMEYEAVRVAGTLNAAEAILIQLHDQCKRFMGTDPRWEGFLSVTLIDLGDLAASVGDLASARTRYAAALTGAAKSAEVHAGDPWWLNRVALANSRLGTIAQIAGDLPAAAEHYRASLAIAERLAATDPANTEWQRGLSVDRNKLGDIAQAGGDLTGAAEHYRASLAIAERLAATCR